MRGLSILMPLCLLSCYQPDLTGRFACTQATEKRDCPSGLVCSEGCCKDPGNLAEKCQLPGGPPPQMVNPMSCKNDGLEIVSGSVWACNGTFMNGDMAPVCGTGTHPCTLNDGDLSKAAGKCPTGGFYAAKVNASGRWDGEDRVVKDLECGTVNTAMGRKPLLVGCGAGAVRGDKGCGLATFLRCDAPPQGWSCGNSASNASLSMAPGGVLCCRN